MFLNSPRNIQNTGVLTLNRKHEMFLNFQRRVWQRL